METKVLAKKIGSSAHAYEDYSKLLSHMVKLIRQDDLVVLCLVAPLPTCPSNL